MGRPWKVVITKRDGIRYKAWRQAVFERDNHQCQHCGAGEKLHPHHVKEWDEYPELRLDVNNGLTLCTVCHNKHHHIGKVAWNKGISPGPEQREKFRQAKLGKPGNKAGKTGQIAWNKGLEFSEETRNKMSEKAKARWSRHYEEQYLKMRRLKEEFSARYHQNP